MSGKTDVSGVTLMGPNDGDAPAAAAALLARARAGEAVALTSLLEPHRPRLRRMVDVRLDRRLLDRVAPSDVVRESFLDAAARLGEYTAAPGQSVFLWLRQVAGERLRAVHRQHLGTRLGDADRELALYRDALPTASSAALAAQFLGRHTAPTEAAVRADRILRVQEALNALDPLDREVLCLRHFEELSRAETAAVLGIDDATAAKRYVRAILRLKESLAGSPGGPEGS